VQRYFARSEYPFAQVIEKVMSSATSGYFERVNSTVPGNIQRLLAAFRSRQLPVIYLGLERCLHDGRDFPAWMRDFDQLGLELLGERVHPLVNHPSWQIDDRIAPMAGEIVVNKTSSSALASTSSILHKEALLAFGWVFGRARPTADIANYFTAAATVAV
jgi:nicotinamidase-related amidase